MKQILLFDNKLTVSIKTELWEYLCNYRFFTSNPSDEELEAEFCSGTGITKSKTHLWGEADSRFTEYIEYLKEIYEYRDNEKKEK